MKNYGKGIGGALLALAFVFGVSAVSGTAQAQDRDQRDDDGYYHSDRDRKDEKREWKRRQKEARRDARNNNQDDWRRDEERNRDNWRRNRDNRNNDVYGNNGRRNDGYGNNGGYNQVELDRGYQQGLNTGASDGQRGQNYDPQRSRHFKNASFQAFREGFVRGYDQGYRQYSGNQRNGNQNSGWGNILGSILGRP